ncbi:MAG TPA: diguanylate cyclase [Acidimicrobiales bacterium]|nr:diguanylate cyclase [Acidimicrobiales bacterium]
MGSSDRPTDPDGAQFAAALLRLPELAVLVVGEDLQVRWASEGARQLLPGIAGPLPTLVDPEHATIAASLIDRAVLGKGEAVQAVCPVPVEGSGPRWLQMVARDLSEDPAVAGVAVVLRDITEWAPQEALRAIASRDGLTGLGNRRSLIDHLSRAVRLSASTGPRVAVLMVDLDSFKQVNDRFGHAFGDRLLRVVAGRLVEVVGSQGSVYRVGGDEFVVLLDNATEEEAAAIAEKAVEVVGQPLDMADIAKGLSIEAGPVVEVSVSVGIAMYDASRGAGVPPEDAGTGMLRDADIAMYRAKAAGRRRAEMFRAELRDWALMRKAATETLANQVHKLRDENRALAEAASTDYRTGLANTATFDADHQRLHSRLRRSAEPYSILLVDIDHFHDYNTAYGYLRGNEALAEVAATLSAALRQGDRAYRYGGEEFAALLPQTGLDGAAMVAERVRHDVEALGLEHPTNPGNVVTVTIGAIQALPMHDKASDVFQAVNALLLAGKDAGRNRVITPRTQL